VIVLRGGDRRGPGGALDREVLFDQVQILEAAVTLQITGDNGGPTVAFLL
jgi:hypothetical protein